MRRTYTLKSKVVVYLGMGGWRFLYLPKKEAAEIKEKYGKSAKGWGSLPVAVTVGKTTWDTSIFPDKKSGTYLLPLKAKVRKSEDILDEDTVAFRLRIR
ncbi:MAG: DUF1905 domain-containing protein [Candidatus Pacebacteria bacterium]|nr:DUF1905 domain-containing protein [Candidatus Paceibacterota bacterium]MBP9840260.1 DUF1905 domain-containing protein [Candidatus Paceibacterota bacterium]